MKYLIGLLLLSGVTALNITLDGRIIGGQNANIADYPYQLYLEYDDQQICGASLISESWALTAAHCVYDDATPDRYKLRGGSDACIGEYGTTVEVSKVVVHPDYNPSTYDYDFALLEVCPHFPNTSRLAPIALATSAPSARTSVVVTGCGTIQAGVNNIPNTLQVVDLTIVRRKQCNVAYNGQITLSMICARAIGKDSCQGDSGGPLVETVSSERFLVGVVSWGYGCARPRFPGVYSNVEVARAWITETSGV